MKRNPAQYQDFNRYGATVCIIEMTRSELLTALMRAMDALEDVDEIQHQRLETGDATARIEEWRDGK